MPQILVFGDSIAHGAWDEEGGWAARLQIAFEKKGFPNKSYDNILYNLAISGNTSENLVQRFEFEMQQRISTDTERIIIFAIGINDSQFVTKTETNKVAVNLFQNNIQELIDLARKSTSKIIFVGLTLVNEAFVNPLPWNLESSYRNKDIIQYDNAIQVICEKNHVDFIDILNTWSKLNFADLLEDGLHPNSKGHEIILEALKNYLISHNIISSL